MSRGNNDALVRKSPPSCPPGRRRRAQRAAPEELIAAGAQAVIAGSGRSAVRPEGDLSQMIDHDFARALAQTVGMHRLIAAVDSRARARVHSRLEDHAAATAVQAVQLLEDTARNSSTRTSTRKA